MTVPVPADVSRTAMSFGRSPSSSQPSSPSSSYRALPWRCPPLRRRSATSRWPLMQPSCGALSWPERPGQVSWRSSSVTQPSCPPSYVRLPQWLHPAASSPDRNCRRLGRKRSVQEDCGDSCAAVSRTPAAFAPRIVVSIRLLAVSNRSDNTTDGAVNAAYLPRPCRRARFVHRCRFKCPASASSCRRHGRTRALPARGSCRCRHL
jgi:hypothetical protein